MEDAPVFTQSKLYEKSARLLQIGRFGLTSILPVAALLLWFPRDGRYVHPPAWWGPLFLGVTGAWMGAILASVIIAAFMKCDRCFRPPTIVWNLKHRSPAAPERRAIRDLFFPPEMRLKVFECVHCGARFRLSR